MNYALNHKKEFMNYLEDGNCSISNNLSENSIRPFTIGRKNWLFSVAVRRALLRVQQYIVLLKLPRQMALVHTNILISYSGELPGVQFGTAS